MALLVVGPLVITYSQYFIIGFTTWFPSLDYLPLGPLVLFFAIVEFIIGYLIGDANVAEYRHRERYFDGPLPEKQKQIIWQKKVPFFVSSVIVFVIGIIIMIVSSF